jgi:hypothetical protein
VTPLPKAGPVVREVTKQIIIKKPTFSRATVEIEGTAPYLQNNFSSENRQKMEQKQREGSSQGKTRRAKPPKDFQKVYEGSMHISQEGWHGIPATAFRNAMIDACRLTEFDMIRAKMCIWIVPDGLDRDNLEPLVRITDGKPRMHIQRVKIGMNQTDLAARAVFEKWKADITIEWDADVFQAQDVFNLLARAGQQVGVGAGRPLSKTSGGTGKGTFKVNA